MSSPPPCPCEVFVHPRIISNPPGRDAVDYRVGDYTAFRHALLRPLRDETALAGWHPTAGSDLALQMLEWWAYLADVLTFYNERAVQEVLLRTAVLPQNVRRIVRLLGYRPRPGIGATGVVAALTDSQRPFLLPRGFPIEGAVAPGDPAQIFELDDDIAIGRLGKPLPVSARFPALASAAGQRQGLTPKDATASTRTTAGQWQGLTPKDATGTILDGVPVKPKVDKALIIKEGEPFTVALDGVVTSLAPDDVILVLKRDWLGHLVHPTGYAVALVRAVDPIFDENGRAITELTLLGGNSLPRNAQRDDYRILRATKLAHLWLYHDRYPGSTNPALLGVGTVVQVVARIFDPLGLFVGGGPPTRPPEDPRVITGIAAQASPPPHGVAHLEAITRGIRAGDPVLFEKKSGGGLVGMFDKMVRQAIPPAALATLRLVIMQLVKVTGYAEDIWYGNAPQMDRIGQGPPVGPPTHSVLGGLGGAEGPIPIPHSRITFDPNPFLDMMAVGDLDLDSIVVHYGWQEVGQIVDPHAGPTTTVEVPAIPGVPEDEPVPVLIQDATGNGTRAWLGTTGNGTTGNGTTGNGTTGNGTSISVEGEALVPPLQALLNLLPVSRGQTVAREILGSGDPILIGQEFVLKKSPLTYLADTGPRSINGYRSTLRIRVDGIEWREVPSFYGQPADARVFVTREDDEQKTHVRFGDGENGARLPGGTDNVVADYRTGSGAAIPRAGTLTSILRPQLGLRAIVNPVPVGGGADPDPPEQIRRYAPRSALTFGRAISGDDYETVAAQSPGVNRARAYWSWDAGSQRSVVKVFVGDDDAAVVAARTALLAFGDPNRPVVVALAAPIFPDLSLTLEVDRAYDADAVKAEVTAILLDPQRQPFGAGVVRIGQVVYDSQIHDACLRVPGVVAVHRLRFGIWRHVENPQHPAREDADDDREDRLHVGDPFYPISPNSPISFGSPAFDTLFGPGFLPSELYDPVVLAARLNVSPSVLFDPFALAAAATAKLGTVVAPSDPPAPSGGSDSQDLLHVESGPRHSPGEGSFYLMREDRLHIIAETARHAL